MNKDVIYIEPEDDITDIITKIENAKEKIVALVPPKKATVLRSVVNIKLIHKAGFAADKTIVLVTDDPSIKRLAATVKMPVTKNLQSAPETPDLFEDEPETDAVVTEEVVEKDEEAIKNDEEEVKNEAEDDKSDKNDEENAKKVDKRAKTSKKLGKFGETKVGTWILGHKKASIGIGVGAFALILVLIWAFAIAPAATITVGVRTSTGNFSENVTFTSKIDEEDYSKGKFYLIEKKIEEKTEVEFEATGKKNVGEKATGNVIIYAFFRQAGSTAVNAGSTFTINSLTYTSTKDAELSYDGTNTSVCENSGQPSSFSSGCLISARVPVVASEPGAKYNIAAASSGWSTAADVDGVYSDAKIDGGSDSVITVVQQSDVDEAVKKISSTGEAAMKTKLLETVKTGEFAIEASFKQTVSDPVSTPAVGEQVKDGEKAKLAITTTDTMFVIDETKVKEFIAEKAKLAENYKIYEMNDPFIENFMSSETGYVGKLKTSYVSGPKVTENDIVELSRGKGLGEASKNISSAFDGISEVHIDPSFPWVYSIPNDPNKITVIINVKE